MTTPPFQARISRKPSAVCNLYVVTFFSMYFCAFIVNLGVESIVNDLIDFQYKYPKDVLSLISHADSTFIPINNVVWLALECKHCMPNMEL